MAHGRSGDRHLPACRLREESMSETKLHWEDQDWLKKASDWIHGETLSQHIDITGPIEQPQI